MTEKYADKKAASKDSDNYKIIFIGNGIFSFAEGLYYPF